jgi:hypothetical protein
MTILPRFQGPLLKTINADVMTQQNGYCKHMLKCILFIGTATGPSPWGSDKECESDTKMEERVGERGRVGGRERKKEI